MTRTRIYVPLDAVRLRELWQAKVLDEPVLLAHAATAALRSAYPGCDDDELEYRALCHAADASAALRTSALDRRIVAAADVESSWVCPSKMPGAQVSSVTIANPVPLRQVASFHLDDEDSTGEHDLLWYDVSELPAIRALCPEPTRPAPASGPH